MAINARLLHPCENPSAVIPAIVPANAEIIAKIKPKEARHTNTILKLRMIILLSF
jgi:hypothetical protein